MLFHQDRNQLNCIAWEQRDTKPDDAFLTQVVKTAIDHLPAERKLSLRYQYFRDAPRTFSVTPPPDWLRVRENVHLQNVEHAAVVDLTNKEQGNMRDQYVSVSSPIERRKD